MKCNWIVGGLFLIGIPFGCRQIAGVDDFQFTEGQQGSGGSAGGAQTGGSGGQGTSSGVSSSSGSTSSSGGMNTVWSRRVTLAINSGSATSLVDFPVLIRLTPNGIDFSQAQPNGGDIRFTNADGTLPLSYEIERWDSAGESILWVKVPLIDAAGTTIMMYYGNPGAADAQAAFKVWSPGFKGVWHLHGDPIVDSTGNNGNAINMGTQLGAGQAGLGRSLSGADGQYIDLGNTEQLATFTVEAWAQPDEGPSKTVTDGTAILSRSCNYELVWDSPDSFELASAAVQKANGVWEHTLFEIGSAASHPWYYLVATFDGIALKAYKNGSLVSSVNTGSLTACDVSAKIGRWAGQGQTNCLRGLVDEVRISNTVRTPDWIAAQYRSMTNMGTVQMVLEEAGSFQVP